MTHEFKYKLDFYYQQALIYLVTLILYIGIRASFFKNSMTVVLEDSLLYIIVFFVAMSFVLLLLNRFRNRKIIITDEAIYFRHRFAHHEIKISEIEWMYIGKERGVQTAGRHQIVMIKPKGRRRTFRLRVGRYERDRELVKLMEQIAAQVPKRRRRFQLKTKK